MDPALSNIEVWRPDADGTPALSRAEMLRYLGHTGQELEPGLARRIDEAAALATADARICGAWRAFPVDPTGTDAGGEPCIRLKGARVELRGRDVYRHLKDADACAVVCCTIGMATERRLRALSASDALAGALYDAACSAYVEDAMDELDRRVKRAAAGRGLSANWRFSCGYGDCPLDAQPRLLAALDATRRCGISATPSDLLLPSKSVTAMIGLFHGEPGDARTRPSCAICRLRGSCAFRSRGTTCY